MKTITRHIPNAITSLNLLSGCVSITIAFLGQDIRVACYFIFFAAIFDFFDGFAARLLKAHSPIGLQLDSLADVVSFGVAPAAILVAGTMYNNPNMAGGVIINAIFFIFPFIITIFSALRLAKFNIDTRQTESFIGMPTPACALFIASAVIWLYNHAYFLEAGLFAGRYLVINKYLVACVCVTLSALLVSEIPMFSLKVKKQESGAAFIKKYAVQLIFLLASALMIIFFGFGGIALAILLYISLSIGNWLANMGKAKTV